MSTEIKRELIEKVIGDITSPKSVRTDSGEVEQHDIEKQRKAVEWALSNKFATSITCEV